MKYRFGTKGKMKGSQDGFCFILKISRGQTVRLKIRCDEKALPLLVESLQKIECYQAQIGRGKANIRIYIGNGITLNENKRGYRERDISKILLFSCSLFFNCSSACQINHKLTAKKLLFNRLVLIVFFLKFSKLNCLLLKAQIL